MDFVHLFYVFIYSNQNLVHFSFFYTKNYFHHILFSFLLFSWLFPLFQLLNPPNISFKSNCLD